MGRLSAHISPGVLRGETVEEAIVMRGRPCQNPRQLSTVVGVLCHCYREGTFL